MSHAKGNRNIPAGSGGVDRAGGLAGGHAASRKLLHRLDQAGDKLALVPQVLAEFVHIVTDPRRCSAPLAMATALQRAEQVWAATQVAQVFPDAAAIGQFLAWMRQHGL